MGGIYPISQLPPTSLSLLISGVTTACRLRVRDTHTSSIFLPPCPLLSHHQELQSQRVEHFSFFFRTTKCGRLCTITWSLSVLNSQRIFTSVLSITGSSLPYCTYHLLAHCNPHSRHRLQSARSATLSCLLLYRAHVPADAVSKEVAFPGGIMWLQPTGHTALHQVTLQPPVTKLFTR